MFEQTPPAASDGAYPLDGHSIEDRDSGLSHNPEGELQVPLASTEVELDQQELLAQARAALGDSRA